MTTITQSWLNELLADYETSIPAQLFDEIVAEFDKQYTIVGYVYSETLGNGDILKQAALQGAFAQTLRNGTPIYVVKETGDGT